MAKGIKDQVAIVGMGCTRFGDLWNRGTDELIVDASTAALAQAGIGTDDVDAFWVGTTRSGSSGLTLSRALKIRYKPVTRVENYCATGSEALRAASYAVAAGVYDVALAVGVEKLKDYPYAGLVPSANPPSDGTALELSGPALFSQLVPAYMERYDLDVVQMREVLTHIAWKNHRNGAHNPRAQFQTEVSRDKISNAPRVAGDLRLFDCSGMSDGAAAAVVVRAEDAGKFARKPLYIKSMTLAASPYPGANDPDHDFASFPEVVTSARSAYAEAGIEEPGQQLGLAEVHDCFTPTELVLMEDLGFSGRGRAWKDVLDGRFDFGGPLPVNSDGGLKSFGHPVGASGLRMLYECWQQLRGEAGNRQLPGIGTGTKRTLGLTQNLGGAPGDCVSFVSIVGTELG